MTKKYSIQDLKSGNIAVQIDTITQYELIKSICGNACSQFESKHYYRFGNNGKSKRIYGNFGYAANASWYEKHSVKCIKFDELELYENKPNPYITNKTVLKLYELLEMFKGSMPEVVDNPDYQYVLKLTNQIEKEERKLTPHEKDKLNSIYKRLK